MYEVDDRHMLMVATDAVSAFDVVFAETVPDKGKVLTAMTVWWADFLAPWARTHLVESVPAVVAELDRPEWADRALLVRRAEMLPIECIVRGYITGSAWQEYQADGTMHGTPLPPGLLESQQLPEPVFTPSTKAETGHDVNVSFDDAADLVGHAAAAAARDICLSAYSHAAEHAASRGVVIADTKFELGTVDGRLVVADEILTPDSSRFWPAAGWKPGSTPPSLDKQPVRDATAATGWDKRPPPPPLSDEVVAATRRRYIEAYETITACSFDDWLADGRARR
ncbi:MAG TPA: phosphoribosylaminoimidazolesuccinocarboxamide synthase, partial [Acidimicrobiaceae bacterium]|nr:phosphoribosylaminoimidazolesuccinocarboxamide synthase [Acidimicrobiaceae bacterium]